MAVLRLSQNTARPADLQIPHGDPEPAAQVRVLTDRAQALLRHLTKDLVAPVHQKGISCPSAPSDSAPELVQLRQSHLVRIVDDDRIDIGDIEARLNDRC